MARYDGQCRMLIDVRPGMLERCCWRDLPLSVLPKRKVPLFSSYVWESQFLSRTHVTSRTHPTHSRNRSSLHSSSRLHLHLKHHHHLHHQIPPQPYRSVTPWLPAPQTSLLTCHRLLARFASRLPLLLRRRTHRLLLHRRLRRTIRQRRSCLPMRDVAQTSRCVRSSPSMPVRYCDQAALKSARGLHISVFCETHICQRLAKLERPEEKSFRLSSTATT